jgi:hypothetical protein
MAIAANQVLDAGTVLQEGDGGLVPFDAGTCAGILIGATDTRDGTIRAAVLLREAEVILDELVYPVGKPATTWAALQVLGIIGRGIVGADTGGGGGGYVAKAVHLNGATNLRSVGEIYGASASRGILSVWRLSSLDDLYNPPMLLAMQDYAMELEFGFFNEPEPTLQDFSLSLNSSDFSRQFSALPVHSISSPTWTHYLYAWDTNFPAGGKKFSLRVNGVPTTADVHINDIYDAFDVDYAGKTLTVFGDAETPGGSFVRGDFGPLYFAPGQWLDLADDANAAKFIANGKPVDLGLDGSLPTGVAPAVYLNGDASTYMTNRGAGSSFLVNGTLTNATTSPSD